MITVKNIYTDNTQEFDTIEEAFEYYDAADGIGWVVKEGGKEIFRDEDGFYTVTEDGDESRY